MTDLWRGPKHLVACDLGHDGETHIPVGGSEKYLCPFVFTI
jgi:hypothetical protein